MEAPPGAPLQHEGPVRVVVCGPAGSGKTCLIVAAATETFPERVPPVLPPTRIACSALPDPVELLLVDTSSRIEDRAALQAEVDRSECIILTYAADEPTSASSLRDEWLPELRRLRVQARNPPLHRLDLREGSAHTPHASLRPLLDLREAEACLECSARTLVQVQEVIQYAQKAVLHPIAPLYDVAQQQLQPACVQALTRVFRLCDADADGVLNNAELNSFQVRCFAVGLSVEELEAVKRVVAERQPSGVIADGLTLFGFLYLHALFIENGRMESTWAVLRRFGYSNDLRLAPEALGGVSLSLAQDQWFELSERAVAFLDATFLQADLDDDGVLSPEELTILFAAAPGSPFNELGWPRGSDGTLQGSPTGLDCTAFIHCWSILALLRPRAALEFLLFPFHPSLALCVHRRRKQDRKRKRPCRGVLQCLLLGAPGLARGTVMESLVATPFFFDSDVGQHEPDRLGAVMVESARERATLVLRECVCRSQLRESRALKVADVVLLVVEDGCVFSLQWASEQLVALAEAQADLPVVVVAVKGNSTEAAHAAAEVNDLCTSLALPEAHRYTPARAGHLREAALAAALVRGVSLSPAAAPLPLAAPAGRKRDRVPSAPGPGTQAPEKFAPKTLAQRQALQRMLRLRRALGYTLSGVGIVGGGVMLYRWTRHSLA